MYKARNYNHPKRPTMEFEQNSFEKSPVVNKKSKKLSYLKDVGDEITLKPFNLSR